MPHIGEYRNHEEAQHLCAIFITQYVHCVNVVVAISDSKMPVNEKEQWN